MKIEQACERVDKWRAARTLREFLDNIGSGAITLAYKVNTGSVGLEYTRSHSLSGWAKDDLLKYLRDKNDRELAELESQTD